MQLFSDLKYSLRLLSKTPAFTGLTLMVIVLSLALYLASYSLSRTISEEPLPYENGNQYYSLRVVNETTGLGGSIQPFDMYILNRFSSSLESFSELGAYSQGSVVLSDGDYAQPYQSVTASSNLFSSLENTPILGRVLAEEDSIQGAPGTVLISYTLWQDYYSGTTDIIGSFSRIDGSTRTIVGVMPEGFHFPRGADLWLPLESSQAAQIEDGLPLSIFGVLKEDVGLSEAKLEFGTAVEQLAVDYPNLYSDQTGKLYPLSSNYQGTGFPLPLLLTTVTLIILAIAIVNLSSLLFIRFSSRRQELSIRSSLGASGWQLSSQVLLESFVICFSGLILSIALSKFLLNLLNASLSARGVELGYWAQFDLDLDALSTGFISMAAIWIASCLLVSIKAYRSKPGEVLNTSNKGSTGSGRNMGTRLVVGFELILSSFLLICCGALAYLLSLSTDTNYGIETQDFAAASVSLSHPDYGEPQRRLTYLQQLVADMAELPGVSSASVTTALPHQTGSLGIYSLDNIAGDVDEQSLRQTTVWVSNAYFEELAVDVIEGREFDAGDTASSVPVVIISDALAQQLWPNSSAVGRQLQSAIGEEVVGLTVVGVFPTILQSINRLTALPTFYRPISQDSPLEFSLMIKTDSQLSISDLDLELKRVATNIDRNIPVVGIRSLQDQITIEQQGVDVIGYMFVLFAAITLVLASVGIYTVIARSIQLRTHEIGVRRALGSDNFKIVWRFLRQGLIFSSVGAGIGGGLACLILVVSISSLGALDFAFLPIVVILATATMFFVVLSATVFPARKAIELEPGDALRYE